MLKSLYNIDESMYWDMYTYLQLKYAFINVKIDYLDKNKYSNKTSIARVGTTPLIKMRQVTKMHEFLFSSSN